MSIIFEAIVRATNNKPAGSAGKQSWSEYCSFIMQPIKQVDGIPEQFSCTKKNFQYNDKEHGSIAYVSLTKKGEPFIDGTLAKGDFYKIHSWKNTSSKLISDLEADNKLEEVLMKRRKAFSIPKKSK
tara:strand:+ start:273 stop:653 length:381 start_codon:yes stop_codon:yes gene_type:complete